MDSGSDLLVRVFAEHFLKYGHSVIVNNITSQDPKNVVWEGIKSRTNASMHFIEEIPNVKITTNPKDDLKMVIVCGLPGTGKTTLVEPLAKHFNMLVLPKELTELAIKESSHDSIPSDQVIREGGYFFMGVLADYYLSRGYSVIMDGVTPKQAIRDMWQDIAIRSGAKPYVIDTICSNATLHKERLEQRVRGIQIRNLAGKIVMWHEVSYDRYLAIKSIFEEVQGKCLCLDSANNLKNNISSAIQFISDQAAPRE